MQNSTLEGYVWSDISFSTPLSTNISCVKCPISAHDGTPISFASLLLSMDHALITSYFKLFFQSARFTLLVNKLESSQCSWSPRSLANTFKPRYECDKTLTIFHLSQSRLAGARRSIRRRYIYCVWWNYCLYTRVDSAKRELLHGVVYCTRWTCRG